MKDELIVISKPKSNISEDIRTIRTNLQFTCSDEEKVLLVASSVQGEGKSFVSSNLAAAFAQTGEKTLLIDCDLRLGRLHKLFSISNERGLSNLLVSTEPDYTKYIRKTNVSNLYVVPRGNVPPNPSELLNSKNFKAAIKTFYSNFDHIILDGVPVLGLPDSLILAKLVSGVVIVTTVGYSSIDDLADTKKALLGIDAKIAGVVINKAPKKKKSYYYYYEQ